MNRCFYILGIIALSLACNSVENQRGQRSAQDGSAPSGSSGGSEETNQTNALGFTSLLEEKDFNQEEFTEPTSRDIELSNSVESRETKETEYSKCLGEKVAGSTKVEVRDPYLDLKTEIDFTDCIKLLKNLSDIVDLDSKANWMKHKRVQSIKLPEEVDMSKYQNVQYDEVSDLLRSENLTKIVFLDTELTEAEMAIILPGVGSEQATPMKISRMHWVGAEDFKSPCSFEKVETGDIKIEGCMFADLETYHHEEYKKVVMIKFIAKDVVYGAIGLTGTFDVEINGPEGITGMVEFKDGKVVSETVTSQLKPSDSTGTALSLHLGFRQSSHKGGQGLQLHSGTSTSVWPRLSLGAIGSLRKGD